MAIVWKAPDDVLLMLDEVKRKHHAERLSLARIAVCLDDSKPFSKNKLNLGKLNKFSSLAKLWQVQPHDFCLIIPMELWQSILKDSKQKEAYLDLQLTRCEAEYLPEEIEENGKKKKIKDEFGRTKYTNVMKFDDNGDPKWKIAPLDLEIFTSNVSKYGVWSDQILELKEAISKWN